MDFKGVQGYCRTIAGTTEDLKWGCHPTFCVADKIYAIVDLENEAVNMTLKTSAELFEVFTQREGIIPAPYLARNKWINVQLNAVDDSTLKALIDDSYRHVVQKLSKKKRDSLSQPNPQAD